jgi:hypothetical protein
MVRPRKPQPAPSSSICVTTAFGKLREGSFGLVLRKYRRTGDLLSVVKLRQEEAVREVHCSAVVQSAPLSYAMPQYVAAIGQLIDTYSFSGLVQAQGVCRGLQVAAGTASGIPHSSTGSSQTDRSLSD